MVIGVCVCEREYSCVARRVTWRTVVSRFYKQDRKGTGRQRKDRGTAFSLVDKIKSSVVCRVSTLISGSSDGRGAANTLHAAAG